MPRIRTIKPEFFLHEGLSELSPLHRLFFIGLWTVADKDGRFENRPKRLKAELLPWDDCDVVQILDDLERIDCVRLYEIDGELYGWIPKFSRHQRPHPKEAGSRLPEPPEEVLNRVSPRSSRGKIGLSREKVSNTPTQSDLHSNLTPSASRGFPGEGKEISDNGKEISDPVLAHANGRVRGQKTPDPRHAPLRTKLVAEFEQLRGAKYGFAPKDVAAIRELLKLGTDEEIILRWRRALRTRPGFYRADTIAKFASNWNSYAQLQPGQMDWKGDERQSD